MIFFGCNVFFIQGIQSREGKIYRTSDLEDMMNGPPEDRQRTPILVIGEQPHPLHSRT